MAYTAQRWNIFTNLIRALFTVENYSLARKSDIKIPDSPIKFEAEATVCETISPRQKGRVYFQGTWWPARCQENIILLPGEIVYVIGQKNITLIIESVNSNSHF